MRGVVEMRFKVGDKVRIIKNGTLEDFCEVYDMLEFRGLEATVEAVFDQSYHLTVDNHEWYWMDELLEPVEEEAKMEDKKYIKFDIPEWVNWLARDKNGGLYGYSTIPEKFETIWGVSDDIIGDRLLVFLTEDLNHYPQVKWEDEEPKRFKDGITVTDVEALEDVFDDTTEPDMVNTPPHYKQYSFEPIDIITEVVKEYPPEIGFHIGTTLKYLFRSPFKGKQEEDINKAAYYLARAIKELTDE